jgi:hypothetical protein
MITVCNGLVEAYMAIYMQRSFHIAVQGTTQLQAAARQEVVRSKCAGAAKLENTPYPVQSGNLT